MSDSCESRNQKVDSLCILECSLVLNVEISTYIDDLESFSAKNKI